MKKTLLILAISLGFHPVFAQSPTDTLKMSLKDVKDIELRIWGGNVVNVEGIDGDYLSIESFNVPDKTFKEDGLKDVTALFQKMPDPMPSFQVDKRIKNL